LYWGIAIGCIFAIFVLWSAQFDKDDIYKMECGTPPAAGCEPPTVPDSIR
jgi:hypothetical protein